MIPCSICKRALMKIQLHSLSNKKMKKLRSDKYEAHRTSGVVHRAHTRARITLQNFAEVLLVLLLWRDSCSSTFRRSPLLPISLSCFSVIALSLFWRVSTRSGIIAPHHLQFLRPSWHAHIAIAQLHDKFEFRGERLCLKNLASLANSACILAVFLAFFSRARSCFLWPSAPVEPRSCKTALYNVIRTWCQLTCSTISRSILSWCLYLDSIFFILLCFLRFCLCWWKYTRAFWCKSFWLGELPQSQGPPLIISQSPSQLLSHSTLFNRAATFAQSHALDARKPNSSHPACSGRRIAGYSFAYEWGPLFMSSWSHKNHAGSVVLLVTNIHSLHSNLKHQGCTYNTTGSSSCSPSC